MRTFSSRIGLYLALFVFGSPFLTLGQLGMPGVRNFSKEDYKAGTQNWAVGQSSHGFIYSGNNKGLVEFNGSSFALYSMPNGTIVRSLYVDENRSVYVGGQGEFGVFEHNERGVLSYRSLTVNIPEAFAEFEDVWKVFKQNDDFVFCTEKAIYMCTPHDQVQVVMSEAARFENFFFVDNRVYVQVKGRGLYALIDGKLESVMRGSVDDRMVGLIPQDDGGLMVVTETAGLFRLSMGVPVPWNGQVSSELIEYRATSVVALSDGRLAFGTVKNGLLISDADLQIQSRLTAQSGLQNNTVLNLFEDARNNLWLALDNGLDHVVFSTPFLYLNEGSGIEGTGYAAAHHNGALFVGTNLGVYQTRVTEGSEPIKRFAPVEHPLGQVWSMHEINGSLWLATHNGAKVLRGDSLLTLYDASGVWGFKPFSGRSQQVISGLYSGIAVFADPDENGILDTLLVLTGFEESARVLEIDNLGHIWVSHAYKGLFRLTLSDNVTKLVHSRRYGPEQGLDEDLFVNVTKIKGELVFTSPGGVYRYSHLTDRIERHPDFSEIFNDSTGVQRLIEDEYGNVWFSTNDAFGVIKSSYRDNASSMEIKYFNQIHEGLVDGFEFVIALDHNRALIGQEDGFVIIDHSRAYDDQFPFPLIINKVNTISETDSVLFGGVMERVLDQQIQATLAYDFNDLRFEFTIPYYEQSKPVRYRYRLIGFDRQWSEWTDRTDKEYTNLPAGNYAFEVQAINDYGTLSETARYAFKVLPPFWASPLARATYAILMVLLVSVFLAFIIRREKQKTARFKADQLKHVEEKEAAFKRESEKSESELIALRNEKLRADINHKTSQLASATMHLVQKSEILMKLKTDLSKLSRNAPPDIERGMHQLIRTIESDIQLDNNWEQFELYFDQVHENFFRRLRKKFPELTPKDQKLCAYLRMNLSTKEIAPLLNISVRGVEISRYRVRKKLGIDSETNLVEFIMDI